MSSAEPTSTPLEIEQKYRITDPAALEAEVSRLGAIPAAPQRHADTYYRHPSRDFVQTKEALRIRRILAAGSGTDFATKDDQTRAYVTYKGPYRAGGIKTRPELEWRLEPGDPDGRNLAELFRHLGFVEALTVAKTRRPFELEHQGRQVAIVIDDAGPLGHFVEIEMMAMAEDQVEACRATVAEIAAMLRLSSPEPRSYLAMALAMPNYRP
jgi:adenylate cyclase class 2